jgi:transcriptional regulator with XRE-family HTH domain
MRYSLPVLDMTLATPSHVSLLAVAPQPSRPNNGDMDDRQLKEFGTRVRRRREALNLTRQDFCDKAGITRTTLRQLEAGAQHPSPRTLALLVKALQVADEESLTGAAPIRLDHPLLKDLNEEDLDVAQRFHHAPKRLAMRILDLLDQAPRSIARPRSADDVLDDRRRAAALPHDAERDASASTIDARLAAAFAGLDPASRPKFIDLFLALAADDRVVEWTRHRKAGTTQRSKRR